ncbi:MAG: hypothetical protein RL030_2783 [Pseudomonadota bacterium]|jgi:hypothetical protein
MSDDIGVICRAGGLVGPTSDPQWCALVTRFGLVAVEHQVRCLFGARRQPVTCAMVDEILEAEHIAQLEAESDARADAEAGQAPVDVTAPIVVPPVVAAAPRSELPLESASPGAVSDGELLRAVLAKMGRDGLTRDQVALRSSVGAHTLSNFFAGNQPIGTHTRARLRAWVSLVVAPVPRIDQHWPTARAQAIERPFGLSTTHAHPFTVSPSHPNPTEDAMATNDGTALLKRIDQEIARRGIKMIAAMQEIDVSSTSIYAWRKGSFGADAQQKCAAWLDRSQQEPAADDQTEAPAKPKRVKRVKIGIAAEASAPDGTVSLATEPTKPSDDLCARGQYLAESLRAMGAADGAETVHQLVDRLRQVRMACAI